MFDASCYNRVRRESEEKKGPNGMPRGKRKNQTKTHREERRVLIGFLRNRIRAESCQVVYEPIVPPTEATTDPSRAHHGQGGRPCHSTPQNRAQPSPTQSNQTIAGESRARGCR